MAFMKRIRKTLSKAVVTVCILIPLVLLFRHRFMVRGLGGDDFKDAGGRGALTAPVLRQKVKKVVDGDTIVLSSGEKVRYAGIDTPEYGEPFFFEAKRRNSALLKSGDVTVRVCLEDPRDKYGRLLGWVYSGSIDVSEVLLREGLARVLVIPPCGLKKVERYRALEHEARIDRTGIWGPAGGWGVEGP